MPAKKKAAKKKATKKKTAAKKKTTRKKKTQAPSSPPPPPQKLKRGFSPQPESVFIRVGDSFVVGVVSDAAPIANIIRTVRLKPGQAVRVLGEEGGPGESSSASPDEPQGG